MDSPNVNLKFEELFRSFESFKHLNTSTLSIAACPHSILPITGLDLVS